MLSRLWTEESLLSARCSECKGSSCGMCVVVSKIRRPPESLKTTHSLEIHLKILTIRHQYFKVFFYWNAPQKIHMTAKTFIAAQIHMLIKWMYCHYAKCLHRLFYLKYTVSNSKHFSSEPSYRFSLAINSETCVHATGEKKSLISQVWNQQATKRSDLKRYVLGAIVVWRYRKKPITFLLDLKHHSTTWKPYLAMPLSQEPMARQRVCTKQEPATIVLLNGHNTKPTPTDLLLHP